VVDNEAITNFFASWHDKYEVQNDPAKSEKILAEAHPSVKPTVEELLRAYLASVLSQKFAHIFGTIFPL